MNIKSTSTLNPPRRFRLRTAMPVIILMAIIGGIIVWRTFAAEVIEVPSESIARTYTEGLGRIPDQQSWNLWQNKFASNGCNISSFTELTTSVYKGQEFQALKYNDKERLLALYRGALSREPDSKSFGLWLDRLGTGASFDSVVDAFVGSSEYKNLTSGICGSFDTNFALKGMPLEIQGSMTQRELQSKLNSARIGTTVTIPRGVLVRVEARLTIPRGVTLQTEGSQGLVGRHAYAGMARIVYTPSAAATKGAPLVVVQDGAVLKNVWVDGQMWNYHKKDGGPNIRIAPKTSSQARVEYVRSENPRAAQNLSINSSKGECSNAASVRSNLVVNSANLHTTDRWADGIATACSFVTISENEILDASDTAIVAYRSYGAFPQASKIVKNKILQAGNNALSGITADPLSTASTPRIFPGCLEKIPGTTPNCDFTGMVAQGNTLWSGKSVRFVIGISVGTKARSSFKPGPASGSGAIFADNSAGISEMNAQVPVYVSGIYSATVRNNLVEKGVRIVKGSFGSVGASCTATKPFTVNKAYTSESMTGYEVLNNDKCI